MCQHIVMCANPALSHQLVATAHASTTGTFPQHVLTFPVAYLLKKYLTIQSVYNAILPNTSSTIHPLNSVIVILVILILIILVLSSVGIAHILDNSVMMVI